MAHGPGARTPVVVTSIPEPNESVRRALPGFLIFAVPLKPGGPHTETSVACDDDERRTLWPDDASGVGWRPWLRP